jgi:nucleoid-associated protein YgaU
VHRDQKIGLSLGVLLVGFAAAFCFRHEPLGPPHPLAMEKTAALDARIEQLPVRAYTQREAAGDLRRQPALPTVVGDLIDASFVDSPIQAIALGGEAAGGDVVDLFAGPPEPMQSGPLGVITTVQIAPQLLSASASPARTAAVRRERSQPTEPVKDPPPPLEREPSAPPPQPSTPQPSDAPRARTFVARPGDTLSGVSLQMYGTVGRWMEIFQANRDVLRNPDDLPVGTTLRIP